MRKAMKRMAVTVLGGTILLIGLALVVLPGPAFLVIPIGLAIQATEYVWARRWLKRAKNMANPRKARRTTRVFREAWLRRWARWRHRFWPKGSVPDFDNSSSSPPDRAVPNPGPPPHDGCQAGAAVQNERSSDDKTL